MDRADHRVAADRRHTVPCPYRRPLADPPERYGPWARVYDLDAAVAQVPADGPLRPLRAPDGRSWTRTRTRVAGMSELQ